MSEAVNHTPEDKSLEKAVWHYVGIGVLWIALILSGIALERLGLTTSVLSGLLPGEVGSLRKQVAECESNLRAIKLERDLLKRQEDTLRVEIKRLQDRVTASP
jgi:hypothetical protein